MNLSGGIINRLFLVVFFVLISFTNNSTASPTLYIRNRPVSIPINENKGRFYAPVSALIPVLNKKLACNNNFKIAQSATGSSEIIIMIDEGVKKNGECWVSLEQVAKAIGAVFFINRETQILDIIFPLKAGTDSTLNKLSLNKPNIEIIKETPLEIYQQVQDFLAGHLNFPVSPPPYLTMATKDEILVQHNAAGVRITTDLAGFYRPFNPEKIFILDELPKNEIGGVIAHELAHAWASRNLPSLLDVLEEGFAQWVEFKWFEFKGDKKMMNRLLENPDPVYGNGLRILHQAEQKDGHQKVMEILKNGKLPNT